MHDLSETTVFKIKDGQISATLDDEEVILDSESGTYFGLNTVGTRIWDLLEDPRPVNDVVERVAAEYGVPEEEAEADVNDFLETLLEADLVQIVESDSV